VTFRLAHLALLALALGAGVVGATVIARGIFDRSYDSTIWNHLGFGLPLLILAGALVAFAVRDARAAARGDWGE
jgi:hypothetical protein